jgi:porphobilinogen synthase
MAEEERFKFQRRPRRLRKTPAIRSLVEETKVDARDFIMPFFVIDGGGEPELIESMPSQQRLGISHLQKACEEVFELGIQAIALFPVLNPSLKDAAGSDALSEDTLVLRAVKAVKETVPELAVITDIALDPYTNHGHDGVLNDKKTDVDNDRTLGILAQMAILNAAAGVDFVAPSDMMDGRVAVIRDALDESGFENTGILAYSAKFASSYYGPFREAVGSAQSAGTQLLGKQTYQLNPANRREARIETLLDEGEGADILMVKPAGPYLDIIRELRDNTDLPIAAYQVSGEYAQIHAAAKLGWLDYEKTRDESLIAIKRAGSDMIFTYFAAEIARSLKK